MTAMSSDADGSTVLMRVLPFDFNRIRLNANISGHNGRTN